MQENIDILAADKIDRTKWNACVNNAANGLIYSLYEYAEQMCDNWHGLVIGDYETVMVLPWRKKYGIRYLYQPAFIQQLGLVGKHHNNVEELKLRLLSFSKYGDIFLNYGNTTIAQHLKAIHKTNLVINLDTGYETIHAAYKKDLLLNLKKSGKENLSVEKEDDIELAISMYRSLYQSRLNKVSDKDYFNLQQLCVTLQQKEMCLTRKIVSERGDLLSIGLFLKDNKRIYNLLNSTNDAGRKKEANHFLLDAVIKEFAGHKLLFDFEGSDLPGVKSFCQKFGAVDQSYFHYHYNKLPKLLKLVKR